MKRYIGIIIIPVFAFLFCATAAAQWSKKDIEWTPDGLTPDNYKLIRGPKDKTQVKIGAVTGSKPAMDASVENVDGKRILKITLSNHFDYEKSWMLKSQVHNAALLKHEQGHFDINEIYIRKMFAQLKACKFTDDFKQEIYTVMQAENNELKQQQQIYERETVYGTNADAQERWNQKIAGELASVPSYKGQTIEQEIPDGK